MSDKTPEPTESSSSPLPVALPSSSADWRELVAVILISVTTILTAWTAFRASKWGGSMSINFSQASAARIDAARFESDANRQASVQIALFTQWLSAQTTENENGGPPARGIPGALGDCHVRLARRESGRRVSRHADAFRHAHLRARQRCQGRGKAGISRAVVGPGSDAQPRQLQLHGLNDLVRHRVVLRRGI